MHLQVAENKYILHDAAFGFVHDMVVTDNYYVLVENPTRMDFWKLLTKYTLGQACIAECLYCDSNRPMKVCIPLLWCSPAHAKQQAPGVTPGCQCCLAC
jgi:hypothetical protein